MKSLFDQVSERCSQITTKAYSTSFSLGILLFKKGMRKHIYNIYGFVRFADEIVDTFHEYSKKELLEKYRFETFKAIEEGISLNPILNSFQNTVREFEIDHDLIDLFLKSMEMDLEDQLYDEDAYKSYILGSAEVVGLMCLTIFCKGNKEKYEELKPAAMHLGAAFQKVNFLRDLKQDNEDLGRTYFPNVVLTGFDEETKSIIQEEIEEDFRLALEGIKKLPNDCKFGVYLAYVYYTALFNKIRKTHSSQILNERIRVPNKVKYGLLLSSYLRYNFNLIR